ncbi:MULTISPECIES: universal stress protein [Methanohalophilus]|uniref:Nucleotide-binding universal stress UspA family protein n=1 Tax=Methanohalophilus euhalobius TaxID=51203 RepID=A0A285EKQ3_9EURY|nr:MULTISPECIES: universal stress protein [Methanohalophilus]KXS46782.1 MAG: UspA domain protein [Methanohalophilus sp. T328-1]RSD33522.1 MAG: UspA domain protein [Methanohalophilus sp.]OBZ36031.1 MAG: universal stress protein [Methanohalophilus sp. DAL1]ODV49184.1 MAG: UspA domain protein [Methanohalophilus sp. 2-GBenrich]PQV43502.1 nucleotide-binding universal stress UspA family protein [Methanohalophilus euhalobius]
MSEKIENILIATDGSENVKNAVDWGIDLAKSTDAKVKALFVIPPVGVSAAVRGESWAEGTRTHLEKEGRDATDYVVEVGKAAGVEVEPVTIEDYPSEGIVNFAKENNTDLIVMGTLGATGLTQLLLGSVAENVVRHAKTSVMVVP